VAFVLGITSSRLDANIWSDGYNKKLGLLPGENPWKRMPRLSTEDTQQLSCQPCPIDFLSVGEWMPDSPSRESMEPRLSLKDFFYYRFRLIEVLHKNAISYERKLLEEVGQRFPQNVKWATSSELVLTWKVASREAGTLFFDLTQWVSCRTEYGGQFSVSYLGAHAFHKEEFDDESLLRFFHLRYDVKLTSCRP
jgi:hypothetical protein